MFNDTKTRRDRLPQEETVWYILPLFILTTLGISAFLLIEIYGADRFIEMVSNLFV